MFTIANLCFVGQRSRRKFSLCFHIGKGGGGGQEINFIRFVFSWRIQISEMSGWLTFSISPQFYIWVKSYSYGSTYLLGGKLPQSSLDVFIGLLFMVLSFMLT